MNPVSTVSNNREEVAAVLAGAGIAIWQHYSTGWSAADISAIQAAVTAVLVYLVGFLPRATA